MRLDGMHAEVEGRRDLLVGEAVRCEVNYERLVELKRRYDPHNLFHLNQNIDPS